MNQKEDYYSTLGVSKDATAGDLKKAYRRLAMKYHPDRNKGDKDSEAKFKVVSEAYEVLSDTQKRQRYDQFGHAGMDQSGFQGHGSADGFNFTDVFDDIFGDIFNGGSSNKGRHSSGTPGADLQYNIQLTLEESFKGVEKQISFVTQVGCDKCDGTGSTSKKLRTCRTCNGIGQVRMQQGFFSVQQTCPKCHGTGKEIADPCKKCLGQGRYKQKKTLMVKIPAGVESGDKIRLTGEGESGANKGSSGDLYVVVSMVDHPIFNRKGNNLLCTIPIDFTTAALGGSIEVPTLSGKVKLTIPKETQTDKQFRISSKGMTSIRTKTIGDLICKVCIETPVSLSKEQAEILNNFSKSLMGDKKEHSPKKKGWFNNVKTFFEELKS